jgi:hypothetical protein
LTFTFAANTHAGAQIRQLAGRIQQAASVLPDNASSGSSVVLTLDNNPSGATASAQISAGPYVSAVYTV